MDDDNLNPPLTKVDIASFSEYVELTSGNGRRRLTTIYRGQPVQGNLLPSLARAAEDGKPVGNQERYEEKRIEKFRLLAATMLPANASFEELRIIAQHYTLKTTLLDWSGNALAALWFACSGAFSQKSDAYVYSMHASKEMLDKGSQSKADVFMEGGATGIIRPPHNNARVAAQDGWFTIHRFSEIQDRYVPLEEDPSVQKLVEYTIPASLAPRMLVALTRMGISQHSLFPDLEGICKHINTGY